MTNSCLARVYRAHHYFKKGLEEDQTEKWFARSPKREQKRGRVSGRTSIVDSVSAKVDGSRLNSRFNSMIHWDWEKESSFTALRRRRPCSCQTCRSFSSHDQLGPKSQIHWEMTHKLHQFNTKRHTNQKYVAVSCARRTLRSNFAVQWTLFVQSEVAHQTSNKNHASRSTDLESPRNLWPIKAQAWNPRTCVFSSCAISRARAHSSDKPQFFSRNDSKFCF